MKIVGLKIEKGLVAAAVVEKGLRRTELADSFSLPFATDAELVEILREKAQDWRGARIVSSIPGNRFSQRTVSFPFGDRKRVEKALPFELEDTVPFPLDDVEIDHLTLDRVSAAADGKKEAAVVGIMLPKTVLGQHLELLASAGVDPQVVTPSYAGLLCVAKMVPASGVAVLIAGGDLCLMDGGAVLALRSFSASRPTGGILHTLKSLETEHGTKIEKAYLLSGNDEVFSGLQDAGVPVERTAPEFGGMEAADPESLGLALCEQINFRKGEFAYRLADAGTRKRRRTLIVAGAIVAVLASVNLGVKYYLVEASYGKLDREIREVYQQTFPDAKSAADPVRQLRIRLDESRKKFGVLGSGSSALDVMKAVTEGIPREVRVSFQEFLLEGDRLKLSGEASSFESVDKMKAELQKAEAFAEVQVQDTRLGVDNKVKFRFEIKLKQVL